MQGYTELLELLREHRERHGFNLPVDVFGTGEDLDDIKARAQEYELKVHFQGARDHLDDSIHPYRSALLVAPQGLGLVFNSFALSRQPVWWPHSNKGHPALCCALACLSSACQTCSLARLTPLTPESSPLSLVCTHVLRQCLFHSVLLSPRVTRSHAEHSGCVGSSSTLPQATWWQLHRQRPWPWGSGCSVRSTPPTTSSRASRTLLYTHPQRSSQRS